MRIGFSAMQRFLACQPSIFSDFGVPRESLTKFVSLLESSHATEGTEVHSIIEQAILNDCLHESIAELMPSGRATPEFRMCYDVEASSSSIFTGQSWDDLPRDRLYFAGTADVIGVIGNSNVGVVIDWKTGMGVPASSHNAQLFTAAAVYAQIYDLSEMILRIVYVDPGTVEAYEHTDYVASRQELEDFLAFARTLALGFDDKASPVVGSHCTYCSKAVVCPVAKESAEKLMLGDPSGSPHALYVSVQLMNERLKHARNALNFIAKERPIDLGDGVWYGDTPKKSISVPNGKLSLPVLAESLGEHVMEAIEVKTTSASIERATKLAGLPKGSVVKDLKSRGLYEDVPIGGGVKKFNK